MRRLLESQLIVDESWAVAQTGPGRIDRRVLVGAGASCCSRSGSGAPRPGSSSATSSAIPSGSVSNRIKVTAGVVTSAAIVMVLVFACFGALDIIFLKQFGVGIAAAILIDATIVRAVLLPATMKLLGDWNWYLPKWLEWLPRIHHERAPEAPPVVTP